MFNSEGHRKSVQEKKASMARAGVCNVGEGVLSKRLMTAPTNLLWETQSVKKSANQENISTLGEKG